MMKESDMSHGQSWRGVFTIPCTPFTETGALDLASLRRQIEFCVDAGAHGIRGAHVLSLARSDRRGSDAGHAGLCVTG